MQALIWVIDTILNLVWWLVIISAITSWLVAFGVVNTRNRAVYMVVDFLDRTTTPLLRPIRRIIPPLGGIDFSPLVLLLLIGFLQRLMYEYAYPALLRSGL